MERRPYRFGHAGRVTVDPRLCLTSLGGADGDGTPSLPQEATRVSLPRMAATERGPPVAVATSCDPPVVSGRWRVAFRRAIASRKAVPADVKDQFGVPLLSSFQRERGKYTPFIRPTQAGILGIEVFGRICESYRNYETSAKMVGLPRRGDRRRDWQCDSTLMAARSAIGPYQLSCLHDSRMRPKLWVWLPPI